jgi:RNA polymerase sigma-70 factor, ECF subfamily
MTTEQARDTDSREPPGSPDEASAWVEEHGDALYRYARARVEGRELAEDLVQETFLAALQSLDRFQNRSSIRTWLFSILKHKIVDHYRRDASVRGLAEPDAQAAAGPAPDRFFTPGGLWAEAPSPWKTPEEALMDDEFHAILDGCLGGLPRSLAEAFILRELEEVEAANLCELLGLSPGNLRVRLHRARLLLRECLEKRWFDSRPGDASREP